MSGSIRAALAEVVSPDALLPEAEVGRWSPPGGAPEVVVAPASEEEVSLVLARAGQEGWRVLPAGMGRWLKGGGASKADLVLTTRRLRGMREYEPADLTFTALGGTPFRELQETFQERGQWLPLDPPGGRSGSLGALVALGLAGPLRHGFGTPRDHVLGLTLVTGDGRILRWGGRVVKNVAGFDLTRLSVGSWGSLGIITSVSARLFPVPAEDVTLILTAPAAEDLLAAARAVALSPLPVSAIELLDPLPGEDDPRAGLAVRLLGSRAQVEEMETRLRDEWRRVGGSLTLGTSAVRRFFGRESLEFQQGLEDWEEGAGLVLRMSAVPSRLGMLLREARGLASLPGASQPLGRAEPQLAAHVGAGVLRVAFPGLTEGREALDAWVRALQAARERLIRNGGTLTLSLGPEKIMREVGAWGAMGAEGKIVQGLRLQFDPQNTLALRRFTP